MECICKIVARFIISCVYIYIFACVFYAKLKIPLCGGTSQRSSGSHKCQRSTRFGLVGVHPWKPRLKASIFPGDFAPQCHNVRCWAYSPAALLQSFAPVKRLCQWQGAWQSWHFDKLERTLWMSFTDRTHASCHPSITCLWANVFKKLWLRSWVK